MKPLRILLLLVLPTVLALLALAGGSSQEPLKAAIVNEDSIATLPDGTQLPGGRQIIAELTKEENSAVSWSVLSKKKATDGLADGTYSAVVVIPHNFSSTLASVMTEASGTRPQLEVHYSTDEASPRALISEELVKAASSRFGSTLTLAYIKGTYDGMSTLASGIGEASMGASELHSGIEQASSGAQDLTLGAAKVDSGAGDLATGNSKLATAANQVAAGSALLSSGIDEARSGTASLSQGAEDLKNGVGAYTGGVWQAYEALAGANATPMSITAGSAALTQGLERIHTGLAGADTSALAGLPTKLEQGAQAAQGIATGADELPALITACQNGLAPACAASLQYVQGISQGAKQLSDQLHQGASAAQGSAEELGGQLASLTDGVNQALEASRQLSGGLSSLAQGMAPLATSYGEELRSGATALAQGASKLDQGANSLADGARSLAKGSDQLATGADQAADGAQQLASGTSQLTQGATQLGEGMVSLADGSQELSDGLSDAQAKIPSYSTKQIADSSAALADPISVSGSYQGGKHSGLTGALIMGALWVSGLIATLALGRMRARRVACSMTPLALTFRSLLPALGVSLGASALLAGFLLTTGTLSRHVAAGIALIVIAGASFTILHEALYAALGSWGAVGTSLLALAIQFLATDGLITQAPQGGLFALAGTILPLPGAASAMSSALTFPNVVGMAPSIVLLCVWALIALVVTMSAIARSRQVSLTHLKAGGSL